MNGIAVRCDVCVDTLVIIPVSGRGHGMLPPTVELPEGWVSLEMTLGRAPVSPVAAHERTITGMFELMGSLQGEMAEAMSDPEKRDAVTAKLSQVLGGMLPGLRDDQGPARYQVCPECQRRPLTVPLGGARGVTVTFSS